MPRIYPVIVKRTGGGAGNVVWGPDFGEGAGSDGTSNIITGVATDLGAVNVAGNTGVGVQVQGALSLAGPGLGAASGVHVGGTVLAAPFWQSVGIGRINNALGSTSLVILAPSGVQVGDLLLASVASLNVQVVTPPLGWTAALASGIRMNSFWRIATSADVSAASYTFTFAASQLAGAGSIHRITGFDPTTPINATAETSASAINPIAPSVTTTVANCLVFILCEHAHTLSEHHTPPASHVEYSDQNDATGTQVNESSYSRVFAAAAATGTATVTCAETLASAYGIQRVAVAPGVLTLA